MNFLFVDQILHSEPGKYIKGLKHVTVHDTYMGLAKNNKPAIMSCIVGEALGQLGAWNVMKLNGFTHRPVAGVVGDVTILGEAHIGDSILLETFIDSVDEQAILYHSVASVRGREILTLKNALGPFLPMEMFIDPSIVKNQYDMIDRPQDTPPFPECKQLTKENTLHFQPVGFDTIIHWEKGVEMTAVKNVSIIAPYFVDHFPLKPVLPLSILLQCKVNLAREFLADLLGAEEAAKFDATKLRRVKMNDFVQPGALLQTHLTLREKAEDKFIFGYRSELNGKRVCVAEITFSKIL